MYAARALIGCLARIILLKWQGIRLGVQGIYNLCLIW